MATATGKIRYDIVAKTAQFTTEMQKVNGKLTAMTKSVKAMGGILAGAFAVDRIVSFGTEMIQLRNKVTGVEKAFYDLNRPGLLDQLVKSTGGAVDNLTLMQKAVQAKNFNIPLERLGTLLQFAAVRAAETGESVDYLVDSIITGLGRKSVMILDNLGISATDIRDRMKETGDFAQAVGDIVDRELGNSSVTIEEAATSLDRLKAAWKNLQIEISREAGPLDILLNSIAETIIQFTDLIEDKIKPGLMGPTDPTKSIIGVWEQQAKGVNKELEEIDTRLASLDMRAIFEGKKGTPIKGIKGPAVYGAYGNSELGGSLPYNPIKAALDKEEMREVIEISFDLQAALEGIKMEMEPLPEYTQEWKSGLYGVSGVLGIINDSLHLAGIRMDRIVKAMQVLKMGFNLFNLITGFNVTGQIATNVGRGIVTPGMTNPLVGKLRGADIHGVIGYQNGIRGSLGALGG